MSESLELSPVFTEEEWQKLTQDIQLPPRQRQIGYLLMCGLSDRQIAMKLNLARPTVRTHIRRLYAKIGVQDRMEVGLHFFRLFRSKCTCPQCNAVC